MIVIIMGVAGSGKSTVGRMLADALRCRFLEGDSLHPPANIEKMSHGIPLTDADRRPWLEIIHAHAAEAYARNEDLVVACSALKREYRDLLASGLPVTWVYLKGSADVLRARLEHRGEHFMKAVMLASQLADLQEPAEAVVEDIALSPARIVEHIMARLPKPAAADSNAA